jgi:uncharacterized protein YbcC (UPF0753/DUF2309 family)
MPDSWYINRLHKADTPERNSPRVSADSMSPVIQPMDARTDTTAIHWQWRNFSTLVDECGAWPGSLPWQMEIEQQLSQFCGLYLEHSSIMATSSGQQDGFYAAWLRVVRKDRGIGILMGTPRLTECFAELPDSPEDLARQVFTRLGAPDNFGDYSLALILEINGWASVMAHAAWLDKLRGRENNLPAELLAARLAWDWVLWRHCEQTDLLGFARLRRVFLKQFTDLDEQIADHKTALVSRWKLQRVVEKSFQQMLQKTIREGRILPSASSPQLQAVFCIDVRSEPMRRALEAQDPSIETRGFAGFFGLPLAFRAAGGKHTRAQLPGLMLPSITAEQAGTADWATSFSERQDQAFNLAPASLGLVEMFGLGKAWSLLRNTQMPGKPRHPVNRLCHDDEPFQLSRDRQVLTLAEKAGLAANVLTHMGLKQHFAPDVILFGHGSSTANNPQAAALDCGACGGQTGEVNVRVLAQLLNDNEIRAALREHGIGIPQCTRFHAGLHDTTTDELVVFGQALDDNWQSSLQAASSQAQQARAESLAINPDNAATAYRQRSRDWGEIRPEWGLANNAAFIVAPREMTRGMDLQGRCFLHDYNWRDDRDSATLELIMTAPMIVTNWINLQYFASVTSNRKYGSGNKLLHNVVGGNIGIFEGNGGDLRIGLAMQSLHDGEKWRHDPLRLSVYIAAPRPAIDMIVRRHEMVSDLIESEWLYLFQIDDETGSACRYIHFGFVPSGSETAA